MKAKLRGYLYQIVELYPAPDGTAYRELTTHDRLEDANKVMEVLESVNYDFTCYGIMMRPVWDHSENLKTVEGWDANGSPVTDNVFGGNPF